MPINSMHIKRLCLYGGVTALAIVCGIAYNVHRDNQPVFIFGADAAPAQKGGPEFAEKRAQELLALYNRVGGDVGQMGGLNALRLPDQASAEDPGARAANTTAWTFPMHHHLFDKVAFYTDLYARRNHKYFKGDKMEANPTGFLIVAWKSGKIERIPVENIRLIRAEGYDTLGFPGLPGYRSDLPMAPSYQKVTRK